jgi:hypothetical protein
LLGEVWILGAPPFFPPPHPPEPTVREGLRGYDPFAQFPNARVVTLG